MSTILQTGISTNEIVTITGIIAGSHLAYQLLFFLVKKWSKKQKRIFPALLQKYLLVPGHLLVLSIALLGALSVAREDLRTAVHNTISHALQIVIIVAIGFFIMRVIYVLRDLALNHYQHENPTDFTLRKAKTRFQLLQRVVNFVVLLGTIAFALMTFDGVRQIGTTLLASAGVVGIIIGFAAQRSLGSLFAGIQIAISQPIRLDDTVVVEGEFGTIGEINLTYVVIHTWDGRRKIVPINYFLENSFENWTRTTPEVVGKVKIHTDYSLPVDEIRKVVGKWLEETPLWDKRSWGVLVTDATDKTMEIRATMSAKNSGDAWDLECLIREKLIEHVRTRYPQSLPKNRLAMDDQNDQTDSESKTDQAGGPSSKKTGA